MGSCCWFVLLLVRVVAGNNREQISLGERHSLFIHRAQQMGKAAELIDGKNMSCSTVSSQHMKEIQANTVPFSFYPMH